MFSDIRPYTDKEINAAMHRLAEHYYFPVLAGFVFPGQTVESVKNRLCSLNTVRGFQTEVMYKANRRIIEESTEAYTCKGLENIDPNVPYLWLSNHRDIMLDAALLQNSLLDAGMDTTYITFGANLMQMDVVVDIGKSNKMFKVERPGGSIVNFYKESAHLSDYIRHLITQEKQSVWMAQRNGRTKDGLDRTDSGIVKMLSLSRHGADRVKALVDLNILPVSVSYEWEPCDIQKTVELCRRRQGPYIKKPGEDVESILTGIMQPKGRVCFTVTEPLGEEDWQGLEGLRDNDFYKETARLIDKKICRRYCLYPNNYIAHDMLHNNTEYEGRYTTEQKRAFAARMSLLKSCDVDLETARQIFLGIYANPVDSYNLFA